jgi:hypothetical protein
MVTIITGIRMVTIIMITATIIITGMIGPDANGIDPISACHDANGVNPISACPPSRTMTIERRSAGRGTDATDERHRLT